MSTTTIPRLRPQQPPHTERHDEVVEHPRPNPRGFDPTYGTQIGSEPYDDPTQGQKLGSDPYDDPTRARP